MRSHTALLILFAASTLLTCCSSGSDEPAPAPTPPGKIAVRISTTLTRVTDTAFEQGDEAGLYIVNHQADGSAATLRARGNQADNVRFTYNGAWTTNPEIYWKDDTTRADFYFYCPYRADVTSVTAMPFTANSDQSTEAAHKAADLIMGSTTGAAPTASAVPIVAHHAMSLVQISLAAGSGFTDDDLASATVTINGLRCHATVDLAQATVTPTGEAEDVTPYHNGTLYEAFVVPQTVAEGNLVTVVAGGQSYRLVRAIALQPGHKYSLTVTLSRAANGISVSLTGWEDDGIDYGGDGRLESGDSRIFQDSESQSVLKLMAVS